MLQKRITRRRLLKSAALGAVGICTAGVIDIFAMEPKSVEVVKCDLVIDRLGERFIGTRIIHISDLHRSATVRKEYLVSCMQQVNALEGDIVVLTGDYVTGPEEESYVADAVDAISMLHAPLGVFAILGNHDYGVVRRGGRVHNRLMDLFAKMLRGRNVRLLRNEAAVVYRGDDRIWIVGLGDIWSGDCRIAEAIKGVGQDDRVIMLAHNPDTIEALKNYQVDVLLCGHTHGGQVRIPFVGAPILPIQNRQYDAGLFNLGRTKLYVNRGLGCLGRMRFNCRPEITVFTLCAGSSG